jgi:fructose-bisphosphate aldolase class 1
MTNLQPWVIILIVIHIFIFLGLDSLAKMAAEYYAHGCRFAKWRAVLKIGNGLPSAQAV